MCGICLWAVSGGWLEWEAQPVGAECCEGSQRKKYPCAGGLEHHWGRVPEEPGGKQAAGSGTRRVVFSTALLLGVRLGL